MRIAALIGIAIAGQNNKNTCGYSSLLMMVIPIKETKDLCSQIKEGPTDPLSLQLKFHPPATYTLPHFGPHISSANGNMVNLPPRPVFTNLGDGSPNYNSRRWNSNWTEEASPGNLSSPRHYHPYNHRTSVSAQGSPTPSWRRDVARPNYQVGPSRQQGQHRATNPFASRTGTPTTRPAINTNTTTNTSAGRQQTMYQSGPVIYTSPNSSRVRTPTTGPLVAASSSANSILSSGTVMSGRGP